MSDGVLIEIAKQIPSAVVIFAVVLVFLKHLRDTDQARLAHEAITEQARLAHDAKMEETRIAAAKDRERERREHESALANMQANNIRALVDGYDRTAKAIADALASHEKASQERYEKMGITQDLLDVARETIARRTK